MAKISFYGSWIDVKSLNKIDKRNYLISMAFIILGALAWGTHLAGSETGFLGTNNGGTPNTGIIFTVARLAVLVCWTIAIIFYFKFLKTQDELLKRYHDYVLSWGSLGFVFLGITISLAAPYFDFQPSYYEFFLAFAIGAIIGGARFHKEYLK